MPTFQIRTVAVMKLFCGNVKLVVDTLAQCAYLLINETENNKQPGDEMETTTYTNEFGETIEKRISGHFYKGRRLNTMETAINGEVFRIWSRFERAMQAIRLRDNESVTIYCIN